MKKIVNWFGMINFDNHFKGGSFLAFPSFCSLSCKVSDIEIGQVGFTILHGRNVLYFFENLAKIALIFISDR